MPRVYRVEYGTFTNCEPTLRHKMIDKISSWKYTEDYALEPEPIRAARRHADELGVESVTPATGAQLAVIAGLTQAKNIVEVGTGAGISSLWLLSASSDSVLTTIDSEPEYQNVAKENFKTSGIQPNRVRTITGKAANVIGNMAESAYDMVFLDIDPEYLEELLPPAVSLVRPKGALVVAHALWRDRVPNPALRDDQTSGMRSVLRAFETSEDFTSTISMVGDGLLVVYKR
jgi:predicted O-methyltransferase YrrM